MADERSRMRKIASNASEEDRIKQLSAAADVRRDIEETLGTDIVNQDKLEQLAEAIWMNVPVAQRARFTAEDWQRSIYERCSTAISRAEQRLSETKTDERMHIAKVKILRHTFAQQVVRAMNNVANKFRQK